MNMSCMFLENGLNISAINCAQYCMIIEKLNYIIYSYVASINATPVS